MGRLLSVSTANSGFNYTSYDPLGRITGSTQTTSGQSYPFSYQYNLAGALTGETYPSGRLIASGYDGANRAAWLQGSAGGQGTNYIGNQADSTTWTHYWPHGGIYYFLRGNGVWHAASYNSRLQQTESYESLNNVNNPAQMLWVSCPNWGVNANTSLYDICPHAAATNDNGNLQSYVEFNGGPGYSSFLSFNESFGYDNLNRLAAVNDKDVNSNPLWAQSFGYDAFGNMWESTSGLPVVSSRPSSQSVYDTNNRLTTARYDGTGNQTTIPNAPGATQSYDAENRISQVTGSGTTSYGYDGNGRRVTKSSASGSTVYVYDAGGQLAAEYSTIANTSPCTTCYLGTDHLGTTRLVTDKSGLVVARHDYTPFGEEIPAGTADRDGHWGAFGDTVNQKFTGKERDSESGLDYFGARYYGSALGRFTSPDWSANPEPVPYANLADPQTLNLYTYAGDNPLRARDPDGH